MSEYEEIKSILKTQSQKIDKIHTVLAGDEFGNQGLVKDFKQKEEDLRLFKADYYQTKNKVEKVWWIGSIFGTIAGVLATLASKLFDK